MEMGDHGECSDLAEGFWNKLPDDLQLEILTRLPVESVYKFRSVCMEWNALLSNKFLTDIWEKAHVYREPWLLVCDSFSTTPCMAYCFYRRTWKPCFSLSKGPRGFGVFLRGSAAGLLLVDKELRKGCRPSYVYNPYSRTCIELPRMLLISKINVTKGIVQNCKNQENSYKVVAVGAGKLDDRVVSVVEIYESCTKSWTIVGHLPMGLDATPDLVFLEGTFYCLTKEMQHSNKATGIMGFSITAPAGTPAFFVLLPKLLRSSLTARLISCGSRILLAGDVQVHDGRTVTLWEFEKDHRLGSSSWKEISTMPPSLYQDFMGSSIWFDCVGAGKTWACFKLGHGVLDQTENLVVTYNLSNQSWSRLPLCPTRQWNWTYRTLMAFEPRPNMAVG